MTKQELVHIANLMYDLQEYCHARNCNTKKCRIGGAFCGSYAPLGGGVPISKWNITRADIERLEESND